MNENSKIPVYYKEDIFDGFAGKNILVTGGGGFLGSYVTKKLIANGAIVTILNRRKYPELEKEGARSVECGLEDFEGVRKACAGMDMVFHIGAKAGYWGKYSDYYNANVKGTENVIKACHANSIYKLIYTSSPSVVSDDCDLLNVNEEIGYAKKYLCYYSQTKAMAERLVLSANDEKSLLTVSLRPHLIWGPGDNQIIPRLIDPVRAKKLKIIGTGLNKIDITYVENAADAHLQAALALEKGSKVCGQAYFISQGEPVYMWEFVNRILKGVNLPELSQKVPFLAAYYIGAAMEFFYKTLNLKGEPPMTRFIAFQFSSHHYFDISKAKRDFGYNPRITTEEGLKRLINSLKG
ncbi:MAG: NAD-dependent epimerase/dehydratase family protein [Candidatus Wallbacteria bacterium]